MITVETKLTFDDVVEAARDLPYEDILALCVRLTDLVDDDDLFRDWVDSLL